MGLCIPPHSTWVAPTHGLGAWTGVLDWIQRENGKSRGPACTPLCFLTVNMSLLVPHVPTAYLPFLSQLSQTKLSPFKLLLVRSQQPLVSLLTAACLGPPEPSHKLLCHTYLCKDFPFWPVSLMERGQALPRAL